MINPAPAHVTTVSIHAPAKGATDTDPTPPFSAACFDPRPREGGDVTTGRGSAPSQRFRSTPPRRGRRFARSSAFHCRLVSIHAPAKGATRTAADMASGIAGFDPRPREGGDDPGCPVFRRVDGGVSIHAPAKGATAMRGLSSRCIDRFRSTPPRRGRPSDATRSCTRAVVSIHAPAKGATPWAGPGTPSRGCFDPRPREGGDDALGVVGRIEAGVSIHAPAKGATVARGSPCHRQPGFDPRPREGGDVLFRFLPQPDAGFRSTPPRRGRRPA